MKRFFAALAFSSLLLIPFANAEFADVSMANPNSVAINSLVNQGILEGYEDGTFKPDQAVTRAEAIKIILLGMGVEVNEESRSADAFSDVSGDDWFYTLVGTALDEGIVQGYEDGTFRPSQTVNRAEAVKISLETANISANLPAVDPFVDVPVSEWFSTYADYAKTWNIEPPQTDGLWHPEGAISRGNISEMIYRLQLVQDSGQAFDEARNWLRSDFATVSVSLKVPFGWYHKSDGVGSVWLLDDENGQLSLLFPYENGGTLLMTRYANPNADSAGVLFDNLKSEITGTWTDSTVGGFSALVIDNPGSDFYKEWYVVIPDNSMVHFVAMRGDGSYSPYLETYLEKVVISLEFVSNPTPDVSVEEAIEAIRSAIQVDGVGQEMMDLLTDLALIETDAIGVGTGPVDYFYSPSGDITIKYERSFDVILDVRNSEITSF